MISESSSMIYNTEIKIPKNFSQAQKSLQNHKWKEAMDQEMETIHEREVWTLVPPPKDRTKILGNKWVYTTKTNEKGEIVRYKARLVAKGFNQIKGESFDEIFSPVVNFTIIRLFFTILECTLGWQNCQLDVKNVYLYADLKHGIYMDQPQGYINKDKPDNVYFINKALYRLHQTGREWFYTLDKALKELKI